MYDEICFSYNFYKLSNLLVPPAFAYPTMSVYFSIGPATLPSVDCLIPNLSVKISIQTIIVATSFFETYTLAVADPTTQTTIGTLSWIFSYEQSTSGASPNQTTVSVLEGNVGTATGIFDGFVNAVIIGNYDNITGNRNFNVKWNRTR